MKKLSRARQIFLYIAPFPAMVIFQVWASSGRNADSLLPAALAMLVYCAVIIGIAFSWDKPTYFDFTIGGYFACISLGLVLRPQASGPIISEYVVTGIFICLFAAAFFPPLFGLDPFTYHYAKKSTPPESWDNPIFRRINLIMTYAWAAIFAICIAISIYPSVLTRAVIPLGLNIIVGIPFNRRFPDWYLKRLGLPTRTEQEHMDMEPPNIQPRKPEHTPQSAREAINMMAHKFEPGKAGDLSAIIAFEVTGSEQFQAYLDISGGICALEEQRGGKPDLVISTPADVWLKIAQGKLDGREAFMNKDYTAKGNLGLLMQLDRLFSRDLDEATNNKKINS